MEVIEEAIQVYTKDNDRYWLKLRHFASLIEPDVFDKLEKSQDEEDIELNKKLNNL
jgi:hypothetical protein